LFDVVEKDKHDMVIHGFSLVMSYFIYDIETYPNIFTLAAWEHNTTNRYTFEISWRRDRTKELMDWFMMLVQGQHEMVGFNNVGFDYPVIHTLLNNSTLPGCADLYQTANRIIKTPWNNRFGNIIWDNDQVIPQVDLFKVHHFDNASRATSLKVLEFNMRMESIDDLPFPPGSILDWQQMDKLIEYNHHDVDATELFCQKSEKELEFRKEMSESSGVNNMNYNDTKIGKELFIRELEKKSPGICFSKVNGKRKPNQTPRDIIHFKDILLPYINFECLEFQRIHQWFKDNPIVNTKGELGDLNCTVNGFTFHYGTGGIHGSISPCAVSSTDDEMLLDIDVKSYYPNLAIANRLYPAHLGEEFCNIYEKLYLQRQQYKKGTVENASLKLALNGTYGDSNSEYSPFFDPLYTMAITVNGQLLLSMLAEQLLKSPNVKLVQINTDGLTIKFPRVLKEWVRSVQRWWEGLTKLELEEVEYSRFFVRDVNNYLAEYASGGVKRKGAYEFKDLDWNKNMSSLVVQKAANHALIEGGDIRQFIENHDDIFDFLLRTKVPRTSRLVAVDYHGVDHPNQNVSRYFISTFGDDLIKIMPPTAGQLKKDVHAPDRRIGINVGYKVHICNQVTDVHADMDIDLEYEWYIKEARKLVDPIIKGGVV